MLISKTPYRISFFGGGTDYPEWFKYNKGAFISSTINKYVYISLRQLKSDTKYKYRVVWSKIERTNKIKNIQHNVVRQMLEYFNFKTGMEIHYQGDLAARSGMGSSSSFVVGLLNSLLNLKKKNLKKIDLANQSIFFEQKKLKENVGVQDQISAAFGGFNKVQINKDGKFKIKNFKINETLKELNNNLVLVHTGINRTASDIAGEYTSSLNNQKYAMNEIYSQVNEAEDLLKKNRLDDFGKLLNESWKHKRSLNKVISNRKIDELYEYSLNCGALGGKILGAGGGGFLLLYVPRNKLFNFNIKLKKLVKVKFKFSEIGSEIILNNENE